MNRLLSTAFAAIVLMLVAALVVQPRVVAAPDPEAAATSDAILTNYLWG